jgi:molecular chaperone DnaJ
MEDYYEILGVSKDASDSEIKKSYRKLSIKYHPDKQSSKTESEKKEAEDKFKELNEAYSVLKDKEKRQKYDQFGPSMGTNQGFGSGDINEFMRRAGADFFKGFGGFGNQVQMPQVIKLSVILSLKDIYTGVTKKYKYKIDHVCSHCHGKQYVESEGGKKETCKTCNGTGSITSAQGPFMVSRPCPHCGGSGYTIVNGCKKCNGSGYEKIEEIVEVQIPKGVPSGSYITFKNKGNELISNGQVIKGDLIVIIAENNDSSNKFSRDGNDLHIKLDIPIYDCLLGEKATFNTIDDKRRDFKLNVGTESGFKFRFTGAGMPIMNTNSFGDLYVHINQILPKKLSEKETKLIKELKTIHDGAKI